MGQKATAKNKIRQDLVQIYRAALAEVEGKKVVAEAFKTVCLPGQLHVVAIGKAAESMFLGVPENRVATALLISKAGHFSEPVTQRASVHCIESDHPLPGEASLAAGGQLCRYLSELPETEPVLFLISGGTSALVEVLREGWDLAQLRDLTDYLLSHGYAIDHINRVRRRLSAIKGGGLWSWVGLRPVECLMISDVPGDDPAIIGSGLLYPKEQKSFADEFPLLPPHWSALLPDATDITQSGAPKTSGVSKTTTKPTTGASATQSTFKGRVIATLDDAKLAACREAERLGYRVVLFDQFLDGDAVTAAYYCLDELFNRPGTLCIWGGETTVCLPEQPGRGGRNQHLALAAAIRIAEFHDQLIKSGATVLLAAGTDGSDGMTDASGAVVDDTSVQRGMLAGMDADSCLRRADSHSFLGASQDLLSGGSSGTNVMDLVIGYHTLS